MPAMLLREFDSRQSNPSPGDFAMRHHLNGIDHCCFLIRDFERAGEAFRRLGFTVSPIGRHGPEMGTGNRTVMFEDDYVELLGVLEPNDFNQEISDVLSVREGIAAVALHTDDVFAAVAEVQTSGVAVSEPQTVRRSVSLPDGSEGEAAFTISYFTEATTPYFRLFCSQILTPEHMWLPSLMTHPNTAWGIDYIAVVTPTPRALAADMALVVGATPEEITGYMISVPMGGAPIIYMTQAALAARYAGVDLSSVASVGPAALAIKVLDANAAAECLRSSNIAFAMTSEGLIVPPQESCGTLLILREASKDEGSRTRLQT